eukprot:m.496930 g.496930  ORF g.496930 m.496930 type:complete len:179 (-) comp57307_c1_seq24:1437-1973(-)
MQGALFAQQTASQELLTNQAALEHAKHQLLQVRIQAQFPAEGPQESSREQNQELLRLNARLQHTTRQLEQALARESELTSRLSQMDAQFQQLQSQETASAHMHIQPLAHHLTSLQGIIDQQQVVISQLLAQLNDKVTDLESSQHRPSPLGETSQILLDSADWTQVSDTTHAASVEIHG